MRECKHGCDVREFCFSRANHASTENDFYYLTIDLIRASKGFLIERDRSYTIVTPANISITTFWTSGQVSDHGRRPRGRQRTLYTECIANYIQALHCGH